jgi:hypothetical protein
MQSHSRKNFVLIVVSFKPLTQPLKYVIRIYLLVAFGEKNPAKYIRKIYSSSTAAVPSS